MVMKMARPVCPAASSLDGHSCSWAILYLYVVLLEQCFHTIRSFFCLSFIVGWIVLLNERVDMDSQIMHDAPRRRHRRTTKNLKKMQTIQDSNGKLKGIWVLSSRRLLATVTRAPVVYSFIFDIFLVWLYIYVSAFVWIVWHMPLALVIEKWLLSMLLGSSETVAQIAIWPMAEIYIGCLVATRTIHK